MTIGTTFNPPEDQLILLERMYRALDEAADNIKAGAAKQEQVKIGVAAVKACAKSMSVASTTSAEINRLRRLVEHGWLREACNEMLAVYPTLWGFMLGDDVPMEEKKKKHRRRTKKRKTVTKRRKTTPPPVIRNMTDTPIMHRKGR